MWIAVFNNLPEIMLGLCWSYTCIWSGMRLERWRKSSRLFHRAATTEF